MSNVCKHDRLARSCNECRLETENAELRNALQDKLVNLAEERWKEIQELEKKVQELEEFIKECTEIKVRGWTHNLYVKQKAKELLNGKEVGNG